MTKQELAHIAKVMYDLQEYCKYVDCANCADEARNLCDVFMDEDNPENNTAPVNFTITKADIERLERDAKRLDAREDFMHIVYYELSDDSDNCRANRIIDAADAYADNF